METRANYLIVGLFTLAVITAGFGFVWWFSRPAERKDGATFEIVYEGTVSGLRQGSWVMFNGIRVGEVRGLRLDPTDPRRVIATVVVQDGVPIRADTRSGLEYQGLTGIASVALTGGEPDAPPMTMGPDNVPRLVAEASSVQDLVSVARRLAGQAEGVLARIDRLVADNQGDIRTVVSNAARFSEALGRNADRIDAFMVDISAAAKGLASVSVKVEQLSGTLEDLVKAVDTKRVANIVQNVDTFTQGLAGATDKVTAFANDAQALAAKLSAFAGRLDGSLDKVDALFAAVDSVKVRSAIDGVEAFAKKLGDNSGRVDGIMADASDLARKLNGMADRLDKILGNVEGFTGAGDGKGMVGEITAAAKSVRELAERLDKRTAEISAGLSRFTGQGLREFEQLAIDGRRTLTEFERTLRSIERNPQQFIFGGGGGNVPSYSGRR